jgi:Ca2+-binding EF-hand superfamily protein
LDRDSSGFLTADEVLALVGCVGRDDERREAQRLLRDMDCDGNGAVDLAEFTAAMTALVRRKDRLQGTPDTMRQAVGTIW